MDKVILNFKLLETNDISINEFLCLLKIYFSEQGNNINYDDLYLHYQSLENKKYIKIIVETDEKIKKIKYTLREKAKLILEASFNDYEKVSIEKKKNLSARSIDKIIDDRLIEYRSIFKNLKRGAMGGPEACSVKLKRWMKNNPSYTFDDIIKATKLYIKSLEGKYTYLQQADYFIYKKQGKDEISRLSAFIEEITDTEFVEDDWTNTLI